jgi:glutamate-ammonia-ligase adenylyltransferase
MHKSPFWSSSLKACADPQRARHALELLAATSAQAALIKCSAEQARILTALFSGSTALSNSLVAHPDWLDLLTPESLKFPRRKQGLQNEVTAWLRPLLETADYAGALAAIRRFKHREMFRIGARDLARFGAVGEIIGEISAVADVCLDSVWRVCHRQLSARHGQPRHQDAEGRWQATAGGVLGLGKLGGQELNYSSDVDVMFIYSEEGRASPAMTNHQFFNRLAEAFIAEVGRMTSDGMLYRIDLRLRPEGDTGPLSRSLAGFENYYAQWGQTWERMMLIKTRGVAGDQALAAEFLEMIQSFRYPRSVNEGVLKEVAGMKHRIETEVVKAGELERNVKLGRGGIREIEFIVQAQQLLHAGRQPFLQGAQTLVCLAKLAQYELLLVAESQLLAAAYAFLRDVEHRLQMEANLQTHTIPAARPAQERLARLMGFAKLKDFEKTRRAHTGHVRRIFDRLLKGNGEESEAGGPFPRHFEGAEAEWKKLLAEHGFMDVDKAVRVLREFIEGPGYVHVSPRTSELAHKLLPALFALSGGIPTALPLPSPAAAGGEGRGEGSVSPPGFLRLSDPDRVVTRLDGFISAYGARATLFELWNSNPAIFEMLLLLFDRSEFLAELAIRTPDLVDELVTSGRLRQHKSAGETLRDLRHGLDDPDQHLWLRRYHQAELMRIGLRDLLGLADTGQFLVELSALADACLQYALDVVLRKHKIRAAPFTIIGLGKLGGAEIDYGSDLDIFFVADSKTKSPAKFTPLALEVMDLLSRRTEQGTLFQTDARLRPDGEKGLLVNTLAAFESYYRQRAELWELQALTRVRPVAGDLKLGEQFRQLAGVLTDFRPASPPKKAGPRAVPAARRVGPLLCCSDSQRPPTRKDTQINSTPPLRSDADVLARHPAAFTPDWKRKIHAMRLRIEKERTPLGKDDLAIKTGAGGLMDAEFIAQTLCLENGWQEPNTLHALERGRDAGVLPEAEKLIKNYRELRRVEGILRRWSYEGETVLPDDPAPYYRVSVRCGFDTPEGFRETLSQCRRAIREVYVKVL